MKKAFIQIRQYILKHKKRLIYGALALSISQICLFNLGGIGFQSSVFAEDAPKDGTSSTYMNDKVGSWLSELSFFKVVINVLIYPILIVAGKLVDNSLVYGEIFGFDAILRNLWVMMRNVANYGLGLLFIYKICEYLIKGQKTGDMKKILISVLIAGIGIQASRFIMSVLIDTSTILTYGVGSVPVSILKETGTDTKNPYVLKTLLYYDAEKPDKMRFYMSDTGYTNIISECERFNYVDGLEETLLIGPAYIYYEENGNYYPTQQTMCVYEGQVYVFQQLFGELGKDRACKGTGCVDKQHTYEGQVSTAITKLKGTNKDGIEGYIRGHTLLQVGDAHANSGINGNIFKSINYSEAETFGADIDNKRNGKNRNLKKMNEIIDSTNAGVFTELYTTLLNLSNGVKITKAEASGAGDGDTYAKLLNEALGLLYVLTIAIPLLAMVVVFVGRIGILWIAIAISPIIVLVTAFNLDSKITDKFLSNFKLENLLPIIFFPAIMCFVISLSAVLVKVIMAMNLETIQTEKMDILSGVIKLNIASFGVAIGKAITSVMCVAITWFLAWIAIKSTKLGESNLITGMKNLARSSIGSLPIVPIPTKNGVKTVGIDAAFGLNGSEGIVESLNNKLKNKFREADTNAIKQMLDDSGEQESLQAKEYVKQLGAKNLSGDWTSQPISISSSDGKIEQQLQFNKDMSTAQQKETIEEINKLSDEKQRDKLGAGAPKIVIDGETYVYDDSEKVHKYVLEKDKQLSTQANGGATTSQASGENPKNKDTETPSGKQQGQSTS